MEKTYWAIRYPWNGEYHTHSSSFAMPALYASKGVAVRYAKEYGRRAGEPLQVVEVKLQEVVNV